MSGLPVSPSASRTTVAAVVVAVLGVACATTAGRGPNDARGRQAFSDYGCVACHSIAGVPEARGRVGPDLTGLSEQRMVAGQLANTRDNLVRWIREPQAIAPGSGMPNLGVSEEDAQHLADFLYGQ